MTAVEGFADPAFSGLRDLLQRNLDDGTDVGASVCVVAEGETVVDLWGGVADVDTGTPWVKDTVVNTYSLTKTMTTLAVLLLSIVGNSIWTRPSPATGRSFAANGKGAVLVRHVLGHTSGVSGWQQPVSLADICDAVRAEDLLAEQAPCGNPARRPATTRRTSGTSSVEWSAVSPGSVWRVLRDGGRGGLRRRLSDRCSCRGRSRIAPLIAPPPSGFDYAALPPDGWFVKTMANPVIPVPETSSRFGGAPRSVARTVTETRVGRTGPIGRFARRPDGVGGAAAASRDDRQDLRHPVRRRRPGARRGTAFRSRIRAAGARNPSVDPRRRVCWWTGYGGSIVVNDLDRRMTFAYVMNKMSPQLLGAAAHRELRRAGVRGAVTRVSCASGGGRTGHRAVRACAGAGG